MTPKNTLSNEQFALKWNNHSSNLSLGFLSYLTNKYLVDVTLAVEGQLIQAHKLVLSICSPYFQDIFKDNPCQHPVVILRDMKYTEIDSLLKFMYQGEVNIKHEELENFLKVAEALKVKGLTIENNKNNEKDNETKLEKHSNETLESKQVDKTSHLELIQCERSLKRPKNSIPTRANKKTIKSSFSIDDESSPQILLEVDDNNLAEDSISYSKNNLININENSIKAEHNDDYSLDSIQQVNDPNGENDPDKSIQPSNSTEPVVTYRLSTRGRPQLVHKGYVYNLTSRSEVLNRSHYRCAEQHRGCRGKCAVIEEQFMPTGVYDHNHAPGYQSEKDYKKKK
ncbi:broad-complex core protein isoforms 1/2/3/4/5-like [Chelonus insularis]|uniref:broad-complex core protein isoforms 1/2/3/4/5-like n=1 Tax=Chelonus insularis TaxID=460826 RepID=UPI00158D411C|nr:broad-complex core protein isoforms 1/2/3/4/5-like [Chelonus insularis]